MLLADSLVLPRVANIPKYDRSAGQAVVDLMAGINRPLDPWQQYAIVNGLGQVDVPGLDDWKWAASQCGVWVPRQNGKGDILMALELAWLFIFKVPLIVHSAHEYKTAQEAFLRITGVIEENEDVFGKYIKRIWQANGEQGVELNKQPDGRPGPRLRFMARTNKAGKGFSAPRLILDEAQELTEQMMKAILFVMSAQANPQLWFFGTPPEEDDAWIYNVREAGEEGDPRTFWLDWGMETVDTNDPAHAALMRQPEEWRRRNPSLGIIRPNGTGLREDALASELRLLGAGRAFAMDRLGMWLPRARKDGDSSIDPEVWWSRRTDALRKPDPVAIAFAVNARRTHATISFAGYVAGKWRVGLIEHREGTAWLLPRLAEIKRTYNVIAFTVDAKSEATIDELKTIGIKLPESTDMDDKLRGPKMGDLILPTSGDVATAFGLIVDAANNGELAHHNEPPLNQAVTVPPRPLAGGSTFDHRRGVEVGPATTAALAMWAYRERLPIFADKPYDPLAFIH
jgi:hypothetical protein